MNNINIDKLYDSFETKSKNKRQIFNDFLFHVFTTFDAIIKDKKHKRKSDKYKQMRQNLINYLIANERSVTMRLCK